MEQEPQTSTSGEPAGPFHEAAQAAAEEPNAAAASGPDQNVAAETAAAGPEVSSVPPLMTMASPDVVERAAAGPIERAAPVEAEPAAPAPFAVSSIDPPAVQVSGGPYAPPGWDGAAPETAPVSDPSTHIYQAEAPAAASEPAAVPAEARAGEAPVEAPAAAPVPEEAPEREGGPNWMLAFVCFWASVTSLNEAWYVGSTGSFRPPILRTPGFMGYLLLGLGLFFFALEALQWGRRRRGGMPMALIVLSALLTIAGLAGLILSPDPGRRI